jgi:hypothetical protein
MHIGHRINERDSITYIDKHAPEPQKARLTIHDRSVAEKSTMLYTRIRPRLDQVMDDELLILWFEFRDLSAEAIRKMEIIYGPWEKNDLERRVEETFEMEFAE